MEVHCGCLCGVYMGLDSAKGVLGFGTIPYHLDPQNLDTNLTLTFDKETDKWQNKSLAG